MNHNRGERPPDQRRDTDGHLCKSPACQPLVQDLESTLDLLGGALTDSAAQLPTELPASVHDDIIATVFASEGQSPGRDAWVFRQHRTLALVASVTVLLCLSWVVVVSLHPRSEPSAVAVAQVNAGLLAKTTPGPLAAPVAEIRPPTVREPVNAPGQEAAKGDGQETKRELDVPSEMHQPKPSPPAERTVAKARMQDVPSPLSASARAELAPTANPPAVAAGPVAAATARDAEESRRAENDGLKRQRAVGAAGTTTTAPIHRPTGDLAARGAAGLSGGAVATPSRRSAAEARDTSAAGDARLSLTSSCAPSPFRAGGHLFVVRIATGRRAREDIALEIVFDPLSVRDVHVVGDTSHASVRDNRVRVAVGDLAASQTADVVVGLTVDTSAGDEVLATVTGTFHRDGQTFAQRQRVPHLLMTPSFQEAHAAFRVSALRAELAEILKKKQGPDAAQRLRTVANLLQGDDTRGFQANTIRDLQNQVNTALRTWGVP